MTSGERRDPYIVLGVTRQASAEEIARAYRRAARASHPDSGGAGSAVWFQAVSDAYDELRDPRRRAMYDRSHPSARSQTVDARGGSVRYAAPGSKHIVLGSQLSAAARLGWGVANDDELRSVPGPGDIEEELLTVVRSLLRGPG